MSNSKTILKPFMFFIISSIYLLTEAIRVRLHNDPTEDGEGELAIQGDSDNLPTIGNERDHRTDIIRDLNMTLRHGNVTDGSENGWRHGRHRQVRKVIFFISKIGLKIL